LAVSRRERAREGERGLALRGRETGVSRRERQSGRVAHGREDADLELEVEIAHHPADDRRLLRVLLTEVGPVRASDVEQLQADRRDGAEVARPVLALEAARELLDVDPGL